MTEPTPQERLVFEKHRDAIKERVAAEAHLIEIIALRPTPSWNDYERGAVVPEWTDEDRATLKAAVERFERALQHWTAAQ
jgi:hypothetical protein